MSTNKRKKQTKQQASANPKPPRMLLAEDDTAFGEELTALLMENGFQVDWVQSKKKFLEPTREFSRYDLVLLDLVLEPDGDADTGLETIDAVKRRKSTLPIVVLTSHATPNIAKEAIKLGAVDFLTKPARPSREFFEVSLKPIIRKAVEESHALLWNDYLAMLTGLSEDALIDRIILPLLKAMGFSHVRRVPYHGQGELGKDILPFFKFDEFSQKIFYAVQAKAHKFTVANIQPVLDQAKTALVVSFTDPFDNTRKSLDKVVIISSGKLTPDAARVLEDQLQREPRIILVDSVRLLELLARYQLLHLLPLKSPSEQLKLIPCRIPLGDGTPLTKERVFKQLMPQISPYCDADPDTMFPLFMEREHLATTGIGGHIAIPHIHMPVPSSCLIIVGCSQRPLQWNSVDGKPVHLFAMIVYPTDSPNLKSIILAKLNMVLVRYKQELEKEPQKAVELLDRVAADLEKQLKEAELSPQIMDPITL